MGCSSSSDVPVKEGEVLFQGTFRGSTCHGPLLGTYKQVVVFTAPLQISSLKGLVSDHLLSMTATGGNMPKGDQKSVRRQGSGFQGYARFHAGFLYIPARLQISLDPYDTLCPRESGSSSDVLILQLNAVLGFPTTRLIQNTQLLFCFVCSLAEILSNSLCPPSQAFLNFSKVKTYLCEGLLWQKGFCC